MNTPLCPVSPPRPSGGPTTGETSGFWAPLEAFIRTVGPADARVEAVTPLRGLESDGMKAMGYGTPVRVDFRTQGGSRRWVVRTQNRDSFGHEREADRWSSLVLARDTFALFPQHVRPRSFGVLRPDGTRVPVPEGTPFLVTDYVEGAPYAGDLVRLGTSRRARDADLARATELARYLAEIHAVPAPPELYRRAIRDVVGHGEGIFGLVESYPEHDPVAPRARLRALESHALDWRWRLFDRADRCRRTHGDFHPFNLLFDEADALHVLDASRGAAGEPADDLCALSINFLFFSLRARGQFTGALLALWDRFWTTYLATTRDPSVLEVVAPFFAWRALVLASPAWYPEETVKTRDTILGFAEQLLAGARFDPGRILELVA